MAPLLEHNFMEEGNASSSSFPLVDELPKNVLLNSAAALLVPALDEDDDDLQASAPLPRKSVSFTEKIRIRECLHINNYTDEEIDACWFTADEMYDIKEDVFCTRTLIVNGMLDQDTTEYCRRGSEQYTRQETLRRHGVKLAAYDAVLGEQELQWESGVIEPDYIAHFYKTSSHQEGRRAHAVGMQDQMEVMMME